MTIEAVVFPVPAAALRRQWHQTSALPASGRANHQETVTAVHPVVSKYWYLGREQRGGGDWIKPQHDLASEAGVWT
jgi:hypothetical protein